MNTVRYSVKQKGWAIGTHLFLCVLVFLITRIGFYLNNIDAFKNINTSQLLQYCFFGLRFDLAAIASIVGWVFFVFALPLSWKPTNTRILSTLFTFCVSLALCFEIADWKYFPYNQQRSNIDVLYLIMRPGDFLNLIPNFLKHYGYLFVIVALFIYLLYRISKYLFRIVNKYPFSTAKRTIKYVGIHSLVSVFILGLVITGIRGGWQLVPLASRNAIQYAPNEHIPIVLNTTFSIITSVQNQGIQALNIMPETEAIALVQPIHKPDSVQAMNKKNIVIFILESFSKEFTGLSGKKSYTPFLDSLMQYSLVFENAYANSFQSAKAIPAILAGIPGWMDQAFMTSSYANNKINSFASLLQKEGYVSSFYHGATNGSMSFDVFVKNAGYHHYFGRKEYNNEKDFDGSWGIWDEPFLQRAALEIKHTPQPFHAAIFNINSHQPYTIPEKYVPTLKEDGLAIYTALRYADYAIGQFFATASQEAWFMNTIFVFAADHCSPMASNEFYAEKIGKFQIPMFIYDPSQQVFKPQKIKSVAQQIDILPTILHTLYYPHPYYALGNNLLSNNKTPIAISKVRNETFVIKDSLLLVLNDDKPAGVYEYRQDSMNTNNLIHEAAFKQPMLLQKKYYDAYMQVYTNDLVNNKMHVQP